MKRFASLITAVVIALAGITTLAAGETTAAKSETVKGWVVDEYCGAKNANASARTSPKLRKPAYGLGWPNVPNTRMPSLPEPAWPAEATHWM